MSYDSDRQGGSAATVVTVAVILVVMLFGILVMAAGAIFFFRTATMQKQSAVIAREEALVAQAAARHQLELQQMNDRVVVDESDQSDVMAERIELEIDEAGIIRIDDQTVALEELRSRYSQPFQQPVTLRVDAACEFRTLAPVIQFYKDIGAQDIELTIRERE